MNLIFTLLLLPDRFNYHLKVRKMSIMIYKQNCYNLPHAYSVKPKQKDLKIEVFESETEVTLACSINRIKPEAADIFFTIDGKRYNATMISTMNADLTLTNSLKLR